ncbi:hypothetical protein DES53_12149 [Roseimicrobium gellanilyticum]|uniref:AhpD family alkylhydroperoxidase n=1 Tax=Roseimicrobium gellanilyticum TaxID=748857 RepID=A0A366H2P7_9BACT|nr:hypothetical protein [Roseimicrobium gellanilyticum]RBP35529.1 hypothetical protein DES53_12149 [Roseimicrobium gellanilyticum]
MKNTTTHTATLDAEPQTQQTANPPRSIEAAREGLRAFAQHYDYDVSYLEALMDASPEAFFAFEAAMGASRFQKAAPTELLAIVKIAALRTEDCGPCTELAIKMGREAGIPDAIMRGALHGGKGLSPEHLDVYQFAHAVTTNEEMDPDLLPRLESRWGREVMAELGVALVGARIYPTIKRALGYAKSCSLIPGLLA